MSKSDTLFNKNSKNTSGKSVWCRDCSKQNCLKWGRENKEHTLYSIRTPERRFGVSKSRAKGRGLEWTLTLSQFTALTVEKCYYCNDLLGTSSVTGSGLDRVDNSKGYTLDNVVPCCLTCNRVKREVFSLEETQAMVNTVLGMRGIKKP